ncbi:hypothetical protein LJ754_16320 [Arthrobacter sp. zg-Y40]|uniref:hypothetical protein n=1 Tax=Arthrobacter sp. zg-Y40 TaxID=2886939 RepID=UPI001D1569E2|nr:hypothetical protein [Arthrobacter sp. zg-Y40]MCC3280713.1 hypothetical protein [Arthrobacter sp. zg-Y40]
MRAPRCDWVERTIIAYDKAVVSGTVLIDDKPNVTGSTKPSSQHLLFTRPYNTYTEETPGISS